MTSRSILVGQVHSKSAMGLKFLMPEMRSRRSRLRRERSSASVCASCSEQHAWGPAGFGGAGEKVVQIGRQRAQANLLELSGKIIARVVVDCGSGRVHRRSPGRGADIEGLRLRMAAEIDGRRGGVEVLPAQQEGHRRSAGRVPLQCFDDGTA